MHLSKLKIPEWKLHNLEKDRKCTPWKITEKSCLENYRMENAHLGTEKISHPENDRKSTPVK